MTKIYLPKCFNNVYTLKCIQHLEYVTISANICEYTFGVQSIDYAPESDLQKHLTNKIDFSGMGELKAGDVVYINQYSRNEVNRLYISINAEREIPKSANAKVLAKMEIFHIFKNRDSFTLLGNTLERKLND